MNGMYFMFNYCTVGGDCRAFTVKDGGIEGSYTENGTMITLERRELTDGFASELAALLDRHEAEKWKGGRLFLNFAFAVSPDTFTLEYSFPDGKRGNANVSGGFPKGFSEFLAELTELFIG